MKVIINITAEGRQIDTRLIKLKAKQRGQVAEIDITNIMAHLAQRVAERVAQNAGNLRFYIDAKGKTQ